MEVRTGNSRIMSSRRVMVYSALAFLVLSLISTAVYYFSGYLTNIAGAFFDSVSAFSATGLSVFSKPDQLPEWLRLFRAFSQWIGGGMSLAILALLMSSPAGDSLADVVICLADEVEGDAAREECAERLSCDSGEVDG